MVRRLCIYLIADEEGIVDEYIFYFLKQIKKDVTDIVAISNGKLQEYSYEKLSEYVQKIYVRENEGFDAGGFKDAIVNYMSFDKIWNYDELLLVNDSFFGPIDSFSHVFSTMDTRKDIDLWSLTKNMGNKDIQPSMQTYFVVFKKNCLHSEAFRDYWIRLPKFSKFSEVVEQYEKNFAKFFSDRGYKWGAYIDDSKYDCDLPRDYCFSSYHSMQYELIKEQRYPVIKRKLFAFDSMGTDFGIERQGRENILQTLDYIEKNTNYNVELIWKQILRSYDLRNIQDSCCLRYILPDSGNDSRTNAVLCIFHTGNRFSFEMNERIKELSEKINVLIFSNCEVEDNGFKESTIVLEDNKGKWLSLFEIRDRIKNYAVVGVLVDRVKSATPVVPYSMYSGENWTKWENIVGQDRYINRVTDLFDEKPSLGLLVAQKPVFGEYFVHGAFTEKVEMQSEFFEDIADFLGLKNKIKSEYLADFADSFWCRAELLLEFLTIISTCNNQELISEHSEEIDRLLPYFAQTKGFYTATLENTRSASITESLCIDYLRDIISENKKNYLFKTYPEMKSQIRNPIRNINEIHEFIKTHKKVGVYGLGKIAKQLVNSNDVRGFDYFIVSDHESQESFMEDIPVIYSSEVNKYNVDGIIMALGQKNTYVALMALGRSEYKKDIIYLIR